MESQPKIEQYHRLDYYLGKIINKAFKYLEELAYNQLIFLTEENQTIDPNWRDAYTAYVSN